MRTRFLSVFGFLTALVLTCLTVTGCPVETTEEQDFPSWLAYSWSNELTGDNARTFVITDEGYFTVNLNPPSLGGYQGRGTVIGKLVFDGTDYKLTEMQEITGAVWGGGVASFNDVLVQIAPSNDNNAFTLTCDDASVGETIYAFFGGTYNKMTE